jgi:hypothetical protein
MIRRISRAVVLAVALMVIVPSVASADTTLGSTTQPSGSTTNIGAGPGTYLQVSSASFPVAVPAGGGRITQWSTATAGSAAGATVQLVVLRPAGGTSYTITAVDTRTLPNPLPASGLATFTLATPIPVNAGDKIGINTPTGNAVTNWSGGTTPTTDVVEVASTASPSLPAPGQTIGSFGTGSGARANVSAVISQSADVGVTTSTAPARPSVGNVAVLQSTVTNHSPVSTSLAFTDAVPAGLKISSAVASDGSCTVSGQTVSCALSDLPGGGSVPVIVLVTPTATGRYTNHVSVAPSTGLTDPNPANNSATATLNVSNTQPSACTVPKLKGTPAAVAKRTLKLLGCKVKLQRKNGLGVPKGTVLRTKPRPGTYKLRRKVTLIVSK